MQTVHSEYKYPKQLKALFVNNKKFEKRFTSLLTDMNDYIHKSGYDSLVSVNEMILGYMLVDYFEDVRRLKSFHGVKHINSIKIVSYTVYWLLRRKPIQIIEPDKNLIYINEHFALAYILDFIEYSKNGKILDRSNEGLTSFTSQLLYYLKYRAVNAQAIEMMIMSFFAGQIYQEKDADLSNMLPEHDVLEEKNS